MANLTNQLMQLAWNSPIEVRARAIDADDFDGFETEDITEFLGEDLIWSTSIAEQTAQLIPISQDLPLTLVNALHQQGIHELYSHQIRVLRAIQAGKHVILTTPTASGKTISAYLPVLEAALFGNRTLAFYGLRALASDQFQKLQSLIAPMENAPITGMITGDVKTEERKSLLARNPEILGVTPDVLHYMLKTTWRNPCWQNFLANLRFCVVDEMHTFRSSFGANMAWLLRRLKVAVDKFGGDSSKLQFICLSATTGNPKELAHKLCGIKATAANRNPMVWFKESGAYRPERSLYVCRPSSNLTAETVRLVEFFLEQNRTGIAFCNNRRAVREVVELLQSPQVAAYYGGLTASQRADIMAKVNRGQVRWLIATESLEAGVDLPDLEVCILRGYPGSKMAFLQRSGRVGRKHPGTTILLPNALEPIDRYVAAHPEMLVDNQAEAIVFNPTYPILAGKQLICCACESGIHLGDIQHYFGKSTVELANQLLSQGLLKSGRNGLWASGFPHSEVNFRGGLLTRPITLIDAETEEQLEELPEDVAYREVHPGALYKRQNEQGELTTYRCKELNLSVLQAILEPIADTPLFTTAHSELSVTVDQPLAQPIQLPLAIGGYLKLSFDIGTITNAVHGYSLKLQEHTLTCFNRNCSRHHQPLSDYPRCPGCRRVTRKALLTKDIDEEGFEIPYKVQFTTPLLSMSLDTQAKLAVEDWTSALKHQLFAANEAIPVQHQTLWDFNPETIALHSVGHQLIQALPLIAQIGSQEVQVLLNHDNQVICYDQSEGGNGAAETLFRELPKLATVAAELARGCDCDTGCAKCLIHRGCPDGNVALHKPLGLMLLDAIAHQLPALPTEKLALPE